MLFNTLETWLESQPTLSVSRSTPNPTSEETGHELDGPQPVAGAGECGRDPAEGQTDENERQGEAERVREEQQDAAGQGAVVTGQTEDNTEDRSDARVSTRRRRPSP